MKEKSIQSLKLNQSKSPVVIVNHGQRSRILNKDSIDNFYIIFICVNNQVVYK